MSAKFDLKSTPNGKFSFSLKAANGQVVLTSQTYDTKKAATEAIRAVRRNASKAERFEKKSVANEGEYFILKAANGRVIGKSGIYATSKMVNNAIVSIQKNAQASPITWPVIIERRAEIAIRSLQKAEQNQIGHAIEKLSFTDPARLRRSKDLRELAQGKSGKKLFAYRGNEKFRLILSFTDYECKVEDVIARDRLPQLLNGSH